MFMYSIPSIVAGVFCVDIRGLAHKAGYQEFTVHSLKALDTLGEHCSECKEL